MARAQHRSKGFTLIELIAVLALIALAAGLISVNVARGLGTQKIRAAGKDLVAALRYTRAQAVITRKEQALAVDLDKRAYQAPKRNEIQLPQDMEMRLLTAAAEQTGSAQGRIRFYPDGSSTGGRIRLVADSRAWDVEIAWLTGEVVMREEK